MICWGSCVAKGRVEMQHETIKPWNEKMFWWGTQFAEHWCSIMVIKRVSGKTVLFVVRLLWDGNVWFADKTHKFPGGKTIPNKRKVYALFGSRLNESVCGHQKWTRQRGDKVDLMTSWPLFTLDLHFLLIRSRAQRVLWRHKYEENHGQTHKHTYPPGDINRYVWTGVNTCVRVWSSSFSSSVLRCSWSLSKLLQVPDCTSSCSSQSILSMRRVDKKNLVIETKRLIKLLKIF